MSYDLPAVQILANGVDQAVMHHAPSDMIARLRGAHAYCSLTGNVLRDETLSLRKQPSIQLVEIIPHIEATEHE